MKFFKSKIKKSVPAKRPEPRSLDELTKLHSDLCRRAGEVQYVISVNESELNQLNDAIKAVNNEAAARKSQDAETAAVEKKEEAPTNGK